MNSLKICCVCSKAGVFNVSHDVCQDRFTRWLPIVRRLREALNEDEIQDFTCTGLVETVPPAKLQQLLKQMKESRDLVADSERMKNRKRIRRRKC